MIFVPHVQNVSLERFSSQMRIVKTDLRNVLSEANLTSLRQVKVSGPSLKVFLEQYCLKAGKPWYNDNCGLNQKPRKKYGKRKASTPPQKEFELPFLFETSSESELWSGKDLLI